jgi:hypothetical protein
MVMLFLRILISYYDRSPLTLFIFHLLYRILSSLTWWFWWPYISFFIPCVNDHFFKFSLFPTVRTWLHCIICRNWMIDYWVCNINVITNGPTTYCTKHDFVVSPIRFPIKTTLPNIWIWLTNQTHVSSF